ncbi:MAG TPA: hypothetical protein VMW50_00380 [Dehalococcoidia bacterium]|nr:hypothetical protein [Dehalococcoidia bacterium]
MSASRSEQNYKLAKSTFENIRDDFYEIENSKHADEGFMIDQTLEDLKVLNRYLGRINSDELLDSYDFDTVDTVEKNVSHMREASYFIERSIMSMKLYDKVHPVLDQYMKSVEWKGIADTEDEAISKFGRFLTNEDNYANYKTIILNIVKGTMKKKAFEDLFNSVSSRMAKPKVKRKPYRNPLPPEMWPEKEKKEWKEQLDKRKKAGVADKKAEFDVFGESFVSLKKYKNQLNELQNKKIR